MSETDPAPLSKRLKWRFEWLGQIALEKIAASLSVESAFRLGERLGGLMWHFAGARRRIVLRNLRIAFDGEHDLPALREMTREVFRRSGANLVSALHSAHLSAAEIDRIVTVENPELLLDALSRGPGVVLMPCHMGNWELLTRINLKFPPGYHPGAFYRPLNNPLLNARVLAQREAEGTRLFSKDDSFHHATAFLKDSGILGILADQRVGTRGEVVPYFGRLTRASPLPALLARRSRTEVLAMSLRTVSPGRWSIRYHPVEGKISTRSTMDAIERALRTSPLDVFWLQERWQVYVRRKHSIRDWLEPNDGGSTKPHRALLWLGGGPHAWKLPGEWSHPDVVYEAALPAGQPLPAGLPPETPVHSLPADCKEWDGFLEKVDQSRPLPLDYILAPAPTAAATLQQAADRGQIPLVTLPAGDPAPQG